MDCTQNIISLCTGYGGIELGLHLAGLDMRTVAYVEIEAFACANLVAKIEQGKLDAAPIWTDIKTFNGRPFRGKVHGIIGGYPCQPFSNAGQRKGTADPRHLWPYIEKHIRTIRPVWCFFENVSGHLTLGFEEVFRSLRDMGYAVEAGLFTAAEVGAPHKRERLFILAYSPIDGTLRGSGTIQQADGRSGRSLLRQPISTDTKLDNSMLRRHGDEKKEICSRRNGAVDASKLADDRGVHAAGTNQNGTDRDRIQELPRQSALRNETSGCSEGYQWPARPGQEQYSWEEPRTVMGNTPSKRSCRGQEDGHGQQPEMSGAKPEKTKSQRTVKSGMGRAVDGFASRVDELRLLGNGVVPQTAELAFRTLQEQHNG